MNEVGAARILELARVALNKPNRRFSACRTRVVTPSLPNLAETIDPDRTVP